MKKYQSLLGIIAMAIILAFSSCKKEQDNFLAPPQTNSTDANAYMQTITTSSTATGDSTACRCPNGTNPTDTVP